jgi:hypothetical protein
MSPDGHVEHDGNVIRSVSAGDGWTGVTWCGLDQAGADAVIAAQISRFAELSRPWEWKHYSYDQPLDLADRLLAAGFSAQPAETLLVAEIADLTLDVPPPPGVELPAVVDEQGAEAFALPTGRRLPGQPADPRASRLRRARHHDPLHTPRR